MVNKYYDDYRLNELVKSKKFNPNAAIMNMEKYMEEYPEDYLAVSYYADVLASVKRIEDADKILKETDKNMECNQRYLQYQDKIEKTKVNLLYCKLKVLLFQNKYAECYQLAVDNFKLLIDNNVHLETLFLYLKYKLGVLSGYEDTTDCYAFSQMLDYSEERFLDHMNRHLYTADELDGEKSGSLFNLDFPFERIFKHIKNIVPNDKVYFYGINNDAYHFKYDNCGTIDGKSTNFFRVILYHDTDQFITAYPTLEGRYYEHIDLNHLYEPSKSKVKYISRVEKFKQKYSQNIAK